MNAEDFAKEHVGKVATCVGVGREASAMPMEVLIVGCDIYHNLVLIELPEATGHDGDNRAVLMYQDRLIRPNSLWYVSAILLTLKDNTKRTSAPSAFPHTCRCGAPAYIGFSSVECSVKCHNTK